MTDLTVDPAGGDVYRVTVTETGSSTTHEVTVSAADLGRFGGGGSPEELIEASFRSLLDREPKESILGRFDLSVIPRYFPDYPSRIGDYL